MDANQKVIYSSTVSVRNNETTLRWTRIQVFFLIHAALLTFLTTQTDIKMGSWPYTLICTYGFFLGLLWLRLTLVIQGWVAYWDNCLTDLERNEDPSNQVFGRAQFSETKRKLAVTGLLSLLSYSFAVIWLLLAVLSLKELINQGGTP